MSTAVASHGESTLERLFSYSNVAACAGSCGSRLRRLSSSASCGLRIPVSAQRARSVAARPDAVARTSRVDLDRPGLPRRRVTGLVTTDTKDRDGGLIYLFSVFLISNEGGVRWNPAPTGGRSGRSSGSPPGQLRFSSRFPQLQRSPSLSRLAAS